MRRALGFVRSLALVGGVAACAKEPPAARPTTTTVQTTTVASSSAPAGCRCEFQRYDDDVKDQPFCDGHGFSGTNSKGQVCTPKPVPGPLPPPDLPC